MLRRRAAKKKKTVTMTMMKRNHLFRLLLRNQQHPLKNNQQRKKNQMMILKNQMMMRLSKRNQFKRNRPIRRNQTKSKKSTIIHSERVANVRPMMVTKAPHKISSVAVVMVVVKVAVETEAP